MNSFATLMFVYTLFTLISSSILYVSFRKEIDASAIYFLISELCMTTTSGTLFLININAIRLTSPWTGIPILSALVTEVAILFSIQSLIKKIEKKWFFISILATLTITAFLETIRNQVQPQTIVLLLFICLTNIFVLNYFICRFRTPEVLRNNQFTKWFTWFELGMVFYGLIRILGHFSSTLILPWNNPNTLALIIFSFYVVMGTFRYISYIGIRITWVGSTNTLPNSLNKPLAHAIEEKDQLLSGLIASNRVIGISALASSLAHQLSQPLTTIALRADTIRRNLARSTEDKNFIASLDEISQQSKKLAELVKNLRQLFGSKSYEFAPINLQKIVDEILEIVEPNLQSKKINLIKEYLSDPIIYGDGIQIQQVLINIINNAIDELIEKKSEDKIITIHIKNDNKSAILTITDNGGGISSETLSTIFELYKTTKKGGLGVGLWLCKAIIERHHGSISASNNPTGGAIFTIQLPTYSGIGN